MSAIYVVKLGPRYRTYDLESWAQWSFDRNLARRYTRVSARIYVQSFMTAHPNTPESPRIVRLRPRAAKGST